MIQTRAHSPVRAIPILIALILNIIAGPLSPIAATPVMALTGSTFNATDGNLAVGSGEADWCTPTLGVIRKDDLPTGSNDDSFKSSDDRDPVPGIDVGSIPNNKVDYNRVYVASETVGGDLFAYVGFIRNDTNGTGTLSFELNQSGVLSSNGVTYERSNGDLLIEFNFQKSSGNWVVALTYRVWTGNASSGSWSTDPISLAGLADGSVNNTDITDCLDGNSALVDGQFGEFALNLTDLLGGQCRAFGSVLAKSRSSNSLPSNLNDLLKPIPVDFSTCAEITILKQDQYGSPVAGATFSVTPDPFSAAHTGSLSVLDNYGQAGYSGADDDATPGTLHLSDVEPFGAPGYAVCETAAPSGYLPDASCITLPVGANTSVAFGPFVNELLEPDVTVAKQASAGEVTSGDTFSYTLTATNIGTLAAENVTVTDDLADSLTVNSVTPSQGSCAAIGAGNTISCNLGSLAAGGGSATVTISVTATPASCPSVVNVSSVSASNEPANKQANNTSDQVSVSVLCGKIGVAKTPDAGTVTVGDDAAFTIVTTNTGTGTARGSSLSDALPIVVGGWGLGTYDWASCAISGDAGAQQTLNCGPEDILATGSRSVSVTFTPTLDDCGLISNPAANVSTTNDGSATDPGDITVLCPELKVTKTPDGGSATAGDSVAFTILTENVGTGEARDADLNDELPAVAGGWSLGASTWADCSISGAAGATQNLTCAPETIAAGGSLSVAVTARLTAADCGLLDNPLALATSANAEDASDSGDIDVLCASLNLVKEPDAGDTGSVLDAGDPAAFTISVSNDGDGTARGVELEDKLPAVANGWSLGSYDWASCAITGDAGSTQTLRCGPEDVAAQDGRSVQVTTTTDPADCGVLPNLAEVSSTNTAGDTDPGSITVLCPDLTLAKSASASVVLAPYSSLSYTMTAENHGEGVATDVIVSDNLDNDLVITSATWAAGAASGDCTVSGGNAVSCQLGDLAAADGGPGGADTAVVTIVVDVPTTACGTVLNQSSVSAANEADDASLDNWSDEVSVTVECPDVSVVKSATNPVISSTDAIGFDIVVSGGARGTSADVVLTDSLPAGYSWTVGGADIADCSANGSALAAGDVLAGGTLLSCNFGPLDASATRTISLSAASAADDCHALISNTAMVSTDGDTDLGDNASTASVTVNCPDLAAAKVADDAVVSAGQPIGFEISVRNDGDGVAYGVAIDDPLPAGEGLDWSIAAQSPAEACEILGAVGAERLSCGPMDLQHGESMTVHVVSSTAQADCATYRNVASVSATNHPTLEPEASTIVECPGLNISKTADSGEIVAGERASYTITVWNAGPGAAFDVVVSDALPDGTSWTIELADPDQDDSCLSSLASDAGQTFSCSFGTLREGESKVITVSTRTDREDCGVLDNTAFADASNGDEVQSSASIEVQCPAVAIEKSNDQPDPVLPGTVITYTLEVSVADGPASDVTVVDTLPEGLDAPTGISDGGVYDAGDRTITWDLGDLDDDVTLTYQAAVSADVANAEELVNLAVVTSPDSQCPDLEALEPECDDESTVTTRVPTLVIDKAASVETVTITLEANGDVKSIEPARVRWTLTYTLDNGPVTDAVISDPLPAGLTFVSASDGGSYDAATRTITWDLGTLDKSGSVSFVTSVDGSARGTIENVATIDSTETAPDEGEDSIRIVEAQVEASTSTPKPRPSLPNTAVSAGPDVTPVTVPVELMLVLLLGSVGTLATANVRARRRR